MSLYSDHFGLRESPFSIAPNPEYLYMSDWHREALVILRMGFRETARLFFFRRGWHGKNNCLPLLSAMPNKADTAFILNPVHLVIISCCRDDLSISYPEMRPSRP